MQASVLAKVHDLYYYLAAVAPNCVVKPQTMMKARGNKSCA